jgi:UDP-N-acetylmuramoylalanine--D-glutamate ligase
MRRVGNTSYFFKNKKVLVMGLGLLGGGVATAKWLVKHGARVTVTDLKTKDELLQSIKALGSAAKKIKFVLGKHREKDFKDNEVIVVNPAVPRESKFLKIAKKAGARLENEASIFFRFCQNPIIAVTGTRGKTTTVNWIYHFLKKKYPRVVLTGNSSDNPMLAVLDKLDGKSPVVVELSSWHLELLPQSGRAPHVAVITNLYPDHLNRYRGMEDYAAAKANIFKYQNKRDLLVLNRGNSWTNFFLSLKPKSRVVYFPVKSGVPGDFKKRYGEHNYLNLTAAMRAVRPFGLGAKEIRREIPALPAVKFRQETIYERKDFLVVNDSTATSPDATIAALKRFANLTKLSFVRLVLIAGGTDKNLIFGPPAGGWAENVKRFVKPENLYLLEGSATTKMIRELKRIGYFKKIKPQEFKRLEDILLVIQKKLSVVSRQSSVILFSPGAASFEKFKNEFDRGEKFNLLVKKIILTKMRKK